MCGIAGSTDPTVDVASMLTRIRHRGPDGAGVVVEHGVTTGHVRLSIIDPEARSDQPFRYGDGILAFNGELWDHDQLRDRLTAEHGARFETRSDTETLAASLHYRGVEATLADVDGMFAFSWVTPTVAVLARGRLGVLPLYVQRTDRGFTWASERKAFARPGLPEAVLPGEVIDLRAGRRRHYYRIPKLACPPIRSPKQVEQVLVDAVRKRLAADVPVCLLLSGGLDSSLITAIACRLVGADKVTAYTTYHDPASPDLEASKVVAKHLGLRDHRIVALPYPTDKEVEAAVNCVEVPNKSSIEIATVGRPLAARVRADGFKVVLSGEAADELFGGYGPLARRASDDETWRQARVDYVAKMGRAEFHRVNKSFMSAGVEVRVPFCERSLVESTLSLGVKACPPGKRLLVVAAEPWLPKVIRCRQKNSWHKATGLRAYFDAQYPSPTRFYNSLVVNRFGRLVRG